MALSAGVKASYEIVLRDLEEEQQQVHQQLAPLQARLRELHNSILTLSKKISPDAPLFRSPTPIRQPNQKYANITVRWAILDILYDASAMTTAEIAEILKDKGVRTKAANFVNNVSAVLSTTMKERHKEVEQLPDGKWQLSENGKHAIDYIRTTSKFQRGCA
jgi:hypothetical protein